MVLNLAREQSAGNIEYKLKLSSMDDEKLDEIVTQVKYRVEEGMGEAIYEIGVMDDGKIVGLNEKDLQESLKILEKASQKIGAKTTVIREVDGRMGKALEVLVRRTKESGNFPIWLYIPVLGNVDSGKSSLVGVLTTGMYDDGNGGSMARVARYLHEIKTRRTSSISCHPLGFDESGRIVNHYLSSHLDEAEVFLNSSKIIDLIDLGGHERYFRSTLKGITGHQPDYCIITVSANAGIKPMTIEHLKVVVGLRLPMVFVITKIDIAPQHVEKTVMDIQSLVKFPKINSIPFLVKNRGDAIVASKTVSSGRVAPIFLVSNVTREGLDLLQTFLNLIPQKTHWGEHVNKQFLMYVDDIFNVRGVGPVISGLIKQGTISENDHALIGPFKDSSFRRIRVKSIHINRTFVKCAVAGNDVCLALAAVEFEELRKGMAIMSVESNPQPVTIFEAEVFILHHPTTIREGYQAVIHAQTIRQSAEFIEIQGKKVLRTGDYGKVRLCFMYNPEFIIEEQNFVFREANAKGIGVVKKIF